MTKSELWILSEWWVACDRARHHGERLVAHRHKTPFAEIDLLMASRDRLALIEVKTYSNDLWSTHLISRRQIRRLSRAREFLAEIFAPRPVTLLLAVVAPRTYGELPDALAGAKIGSQNQPQNEPQNQLQNEPLMPPLVRYFDPCDGINGWLEG